MQQLTSLLQAGLIHLQNQAQLLCWWLSVSVIRPAMCCLSLASRHGVHSAVVVVLSCYQGSDTLSFCALRLDPAAGSSVLADSCLQAAMAQGADCVIQSTHKTLSALTQAAMLHVKGSRMDRGRISRALQLLQVHS